MLLTLEPIEAEAMKLSPEERALLVERLISSMAPEFEFEEEWYAEVMRRNAAVDAGDAELSSLEDALASARRAIA